MESTSGQQIEQHYFACDWVIRPYANYRLLVDTAKELGCRLVRIRPDYIDENGYHVVRFAIHVPSGETLQEFVGKAGEKAGLSQWHPVTEEYFQKGGAFFNIDSAPVSLWGPWLDGMNFIGEENERIRQRLDQRDQGT
jgi:hypothetical protein